MIKNYFYIKFLFAICLLTILSLFVIKKYYIPRVKKNYLENSKLILEELEKNNQINDELFKKIKKYYINLERSDDRKEMIENQFKKYNLENYERIEACDREKIKTQKEGDFGHLTFTNYNDTKTQIGEISCTCSHLKAIKKAYDDNQEIAVIMEDDISFCLVPYWKEQLEEIVKRLPNDWEILQMSAGDKIRNKNIGLNQFFQIFTTDKVEQKIFKRKKNSWCANIYLVNKRTMEKVIKKYFKSDNELIFTEKRNVYDNEIFDQFNVYYLNIDLFPRDSFNFRSTIRGKYRNSKKKIGEEKKDGKIRSYYDSISLLKKYLL